MRAWEKELYSYQLKPAPPKMSPQEYIERYLAEKDDKYFSWYLHYNEKYINEKAKGYVQEYAMQTILRSYRSRMALRYTLCFIHSPFFTSYHLNSVTSVSHFSFGLSA